MADMMIPGVPETITREDYKRLIESVGFNADVLVELRFTHTGIYATSYVRDAEGHLVADGREPALHEVFVRVEDEA